MVRPPSDQNVLYVDNAFVAPLLPEIRYSNRLICKNHNELHRKDKNRKDAIKKYIAFDEIDQGEPTKD